jgi:hypothetical protein
LAGGSGLLTAVGVAIGISVMRFCGVYLSLSVYGAQSALVSFLDVNQGSNW